jgi:hypothetical protein
MASRSKKKTTMAKLTRESRLRERRVEKQARKVARKAAAQNPDEVGEALTDGADESIEPGSGQPDVQALDAGVH